MKFGSPPPCQILLPSCNVSPVRGEKNSKWAYEYLKYPELCAARNTAGNNKHFSQLAQQHGGKTAGRHMLWRNYVTVILSKFPSTFKQATVTPLIKGHSLAKSILSNYRPISNLNFISKILEPLFLVRFQSHVLNSSNFNQYQFAYRPSCSTKKASQLLLDRIYRCA